MDRSPGTETSDDSPVTGVARRLDDGAGLRSTTTAQGERLLPWAVILVTAALFGAIFIASRVGADPLELERRLSMDGALPPDFVLSDSSHVAPFTISVPGLSQTWPGLAICLESMDGRRHLMVTSEAMLRRRLQGLDARLGLLAGFCAEASYACWPDLPPQCGEDL